MIFFDRAKLSFKDGKLEFLLAGAGARNMKKLLIASIPLLFVLSSPLYAGVAMDMVTKDASGQETERSRMYAQSGMLRVDGGADGSSSNVSMIFLGDEFLVLDHAEKSYIIMDEAMLDEFASRISDAMQQIEAQLASLPPEQRAMAEQMMKGQMQGMTGKSASPSPAPRIEAIGTGKWHDQSCAQYAVHEGGQKTQEICVASLDHIQGSDDMMQAFRQMADYVKQLTEALPFSTDESMNPGELMDQIDGFPVHRIAYQDGEVTQEDILESLTEKELDESLFEAPGDYNRQDPFQRR